MAVVPVSEASIELAAKVLRSGELVAFPTETVYGLGADARNGEAVAKVYVAKGRPQFNPLIVHVSSYAEAQSIGHFGGIAERLAWEFWPGALTLVVPLRDDAGISSLVTAGLDTIAIRVPDHPVAQRLLAAAGIPIAAPSANRSGHVSPTTAQHVLDDLGAIPAVILDGGPAAHGLESTVLDVTGEAIVELRPGAVTRDEIAAVAGRDVLVVGGAGEAPRSPGMLASHYAPRTKVRIEARSVEPDEALLAFGPSVPAHGGPMVNLSERGDLIEAASRLFAALRKLDQTGARAIAVMSVPEDGIGVAINDRLRRAAAGR